MKLKSNFRRRTALTGLSVLFAVFIFSLFASAAVNDVLAGQDKFSDYDEMQQILSSRGEIKIIVKLNVPGIKELTAAAIEVRKAKAPKQASLNRPKADSALKGAIASAAHAVLEKLEGARFRVSRIYSHIPFMALDASDEAFAILESLPEVLYIQHNRAYKIIEPVTGKDEGISKPMLGGSVEIIGADIAHGMGYTGAGYYVAVLDTGIRRTHEFFNGKHIIEACFSTGDNGGECPNGQTQMTGEGSAAHHPNTYMAWDHGTHVAGIAVGDNGSLFGVARDANLIAVQVSHMYDGDCDPRVSGTQPCVHFDPDDVAAGLDHVFGLQGTYVDWNENGTLEANEIINIAAVNLSLGGGAHSNACNNDVRAAAIGLLEDINIPTVVATGNNGYCGFISAPACVTDAVAVGATTRNDEMLQFTNWHADLLELLAPGDDINTSGGSADDYYGVISLTSAATPHVTGAMTLLKQARPNASVTDLVQDLQRTGVPIDPTCPGETAQKPRIQVDEAILDDDLTLIAPNNGESWERGTTQNITWDPGDVTGSVKLVLRRQDGSYVGLIDDYIDANDGSYPWVVGTLRGGTAAYGNDYTIRIREMAGDQVYDDSDVPFTILGIKVTSPNGGEGWNLNSTQNITWDAGGFTGDVKLVLWNNGNYVALIKSSIDAAAGTFPWNVGKLENGTFVSPGTTYTIRIRQLTGQQVYDDSNAAFKIGKIEVNAPTANAAWEIGCTKTITWSAQGITGPVRIVLWKNGEYISIVQDGIPASTTSYNWQVGQLKSGGTALPGEGYVIKVREEGGSEIQDNSDAFILAEQTPFKALYFPGTVEAEDYDNGGEGIAYHDTTPGNICNPPRYRFEDVDIQLCYDVGGGYNVGWIDAGEWLEYTVNVAQNGYYDIGVRAAAPNGGAFSIHTETGCGNTAPLINYREFLATGGSQNWETITIPRVFLGAGVKVFRFKAEVGYFNLNRITASLSNQSPYGGLTRTIPGTIQAEDYDVGGEGISYHDTTPGNICYYAAYRTDDVDVENSPLSGSTVNVGYIDTGEWLEYTVDINQSGYYDVAARVAPPTGGGFSMEIDGILFGTISFPASGLDPQDYSFVTLSNVYLPKGKTVLRVNMLQALWNFDYIQFIKR